MDLQLTGRTVLVTGGSSGVGLATVVSLLGEGANVITCGRRLDKLEKALADVGARGDRVHAARSGASSTRASGGSAAWTAWSTTPASRG